jgi:outer membrane protein OmpA-like peptidoglycan-associated protein
MRGHRAHVALTLIAAAIAATGGAAPLWAQTVTSPYIETNPNVTVDLSVLNGLGGSAGTMPGYAPPMPSPGAYPTPGVTTGAPTNIPSFLVRPDAPRYAAPPPAVQALIQGRSGSAPSSSVAAVPRASSPTPAPTLREPTPRPSSASASAAVPKPEAPKPATPKPQPQQTASAAPTPPPPPPAPSASSAAAATPPAPPPPAPPAPTRSASVTPPPPPPAVPRQEPTQASAPAAATSAPAPQPSSQSASGDTTRIAFPNGQSQLPGDAAAKLDPVIAKLKQDSGLRLQLMAYANGDQDGANKARRLSLSRALAVRAYLIDNDIASTRMDVRALGNRADDGPADRVDLVVINR